MIRSVARCALIATIAASGFGCSIGDDATSTSRTARTTTTTTAATPSTVGRSVTQALLDQVCSGAPSITDAGVISAPQITEASGLVASRDQPGVWWVHNDSGDSARIFAIDDSGQLLDLVGLAGADNRDWEDIAIGPGASPEEPDQIYVGDIGDNALLQNDVEGARDSIQVFRLDEPIVDTGASAGAQPPPVPVDTLTFVYPDGPHDAESLLVDPIEGDLLIITKNWARAGDSGVYRAPVGLQNGSTTTLEHVATVPIEPGTLVTGADVSPDGTVVALRSYGAVDLYERPAGSPLWSAFDQTPCAGPVPIESQGEAIGFAADGASYMTVSEGDEPDLHRTTG